MLMPAMRGARFRRVIVNRPDLRIPFPERFAQRLRGQSVVAVERRGKYLALLISSGESLVMHLGMSGWFYLSATGDRSREPDPHDHVIFVMSSGKTVVFNDPRRFGFMDLAAVAAEYPSLRALGPEPLSRDFTPAALARACRGRRTSLKAALLDQRVVAGVGNIYASEALHHAKVSPLRIAATLADRLGRPNARTIAVVKGIKAVLGAAIRRRESPYGSARFRVYERAGQKCLRPGCGGVIKAVTQTGRSTYYCPTCQR
jgi:formamidopyrimidine-DNA glycosylase